MPDLAAQKYVAIERAKGYSSGYSKIIDETRYINSLIYLLGSGKGVATLIPTDDIASSKTWTIITSPASGTFPTCVADHDDTTSCSWSLGTSFVDLFRLDLGTTRSGLIRLVTSGTQSPTILVYGSNDGTTWSQLAYLTLGTSKAESLVYSAGYRYYKVTAALSASGTLYIYSFEFYPDYPLPYIRSFFNLVGRIVIFVYSAYYQLLEVILFA